MYTTIAIILIAVGLFLVIPGLIFPPIAILGLAVAFAGYLLLKRARVVALRRQQGRGWLD